MLSLAVLLALAAPSHAEDGEGSGLGDYPTPWLNRPVEGPLGGAVFVRAPRLDRERFGDLPVRFDFNAELSASLKDVAVLDLSCGAEAATLCREPQPPIQPSAGRPR